MKYTNMLTKKDIGKKIVMFRKIEDKDWGMIGKIKVRCKVGEPVTLKHIAINNQFSSLHTDKDGYYPAHCFKLFEEPYEIY